MGYDGRSSEGPVHFTCAASGRRSIDRNAPGTKTSGSVRVLQVQEVAGCVGRKLSYEGEDDVERKLGRYPWLRASLAHLVSREQASNDEAEDARTIFLRPLQQQVSPLLAFPTVAPSLGEVGLRTGHHHASHFQGCGH